MIQDVFIIGAAGKVGKTLVTQIIEKGDVSASRHANPQGLWGWHPAHMSFIYQKVFLQTKHTLL